VFSLSGIYHVIYSRASGRVDHDLGTMAFFQAFAIAIMVEDGIQAIGRRLSGVTRDTEVVPIWKKLVGYVWVVICFTIIAPWMTMPTSRIAHQEQWILPYSFVKEVGIQPVSIVLAIGALFNLMVFKAEI
jgi:hypothetical protein